MHANPGVYALLLGAGISMSSGVLSAWEVKNELCKKLAICQGAGEVKDGVAWYEEQFGEVPSYSKAFETLSTSGVERVGLLKHYFEANDEDLSLGHKTPTEAHKAIARLVHRGFVRVIITTNFDRLLETALRELGVEPVVISTDQDATSKPPFVHNRCTIFKIHGDYLDPTLRNTTDELSSYSAPLGRRLLQVLNEYGIVVSGWSGESDLALCEALLSPESQQYASFYWCTRKTELPSHAENIVRYRGGYPVLSTSADEFFRTVADNVEGLEQMTEQRSWDISLARARARQYINDPARQSLYIDSVLQESRRVAGDMDAIFSKGEENSGLAPLALLEYIENRTLLLRTLLATGCFYLQGDISGTWKRSIEILLPRHNGYIQQSGPSLYPALLSFYTIGVSSRLRNLDLVTKEILSDTFWQFYNRPDVNLSLATLLYPRNILNDTIPEFRQVPSSQRYLFDESDRKPRLWGPILEYASSNQDFMDALTSFELLLGATFCTERPNPGWAPPLTAYVLNPMRRDSIPAQAQATIEEVSRLKEQGRIWEPVRSGLFHGDMALCLDMLSQYKECLVNLRYI